MAKTTTRAALEPQRKHGKLRVAALMEAGAAVIAERGFEAATMAEIAARADAPIGSLYRFFPNKQALGEALIQRYLELVGAAFDSVSDDVSELPTAAFADALLLVMLDIRGETKSAVLALFEAQSNWSTKRAEFRDTILGMISQKLKRRNPRLADDTAMNISQVLLQNIKAMYKLVAEPEHAECAYTDCAGAIAELQEMTRLYLATKLNNPA